MGNEKSTRIENSKGCDNAAGCGTEKADGAFALDPGALDAAIEDYIEREWDQVLEDIENLVSIESVEDMGSARSGAPFGEGPARALEQTLGIASRMGFDVANAAGYIGIADWRGDSDDQLAIIGHVDVVAAGPGWSCDPFAITRSDGYLMGRGTTDDKAPLLVAMHAVRFWMDHGARLPYTVRVLVGANEETQMDDVRAYLKSHAAPAFLITPDAEFPVCYGEKGVVNLLLESREIRDGRIVSIEGGTAVNAVPGFAMATVRADVSECPSADGIEVRACCDDAAARTGDAASGTVATGKESAGSGTGDGRVRIQAVGKSAHASTPELGKSAIGMLCSYLVQNDLCSPVEREFLQLMLECIDHTDGSGIGIECSDPDFGDLTLACGIVSLMGGKLQLTLDARFPTTATAASILETVRGRAARIGATAEKTMSKEPFICNPDSPAVQALLSAYNEVTGENAEPFTMGGGTYARMFPHGASFGIEKPWVQKPEWAGGMHGPDEAVSEESLKEEFRIYVKTLARLMNVDLGSNGPKPEGWLRAAADLSEPLACEGAMGTMLQELGADLAMGSLQLNATNPEMVRRVHEMYREVGATCAITNSFDPCPPNGGEAAERAVADSVRIAREAGYGVVLGDMGPTGQVLEPLGTTTFDEQFATYRHHISLLAEAGADAILLETFIDIADLRCALLAAAEAAPGIPVIASCSFGEGGRMPLSSTTPAVAAIISESLGASMVGSNCGLGPEEMEGIIREMSLATSLPLIAQPNAGMPSPDADGNAVYPGTPEEMAAMVRRFVELGCCIVGSCCGSTPEFTSAISRELHSAKPLMRAVPAGAAPADAGKAAGMDAGSDAGSGTGSGSCAGADPRIATIADVLPAHDGRISCEDAAFLDCSDGVDPWDVLENVTASPLVVEFGADLDALETALKLYPGQAVVCFGEQADPTVNARADELVRKYGAVAAARSAGDSTYLAMR